MTASTSVEETKKQADQCYRNKDYQEAIKFYSIAIENASSEDDKLHLYYSNRCVSIILIFNIVFMIYDINLYILYP
jgi:hypothetical protein